MTVADAQKDMRLAYLGGAPGLFASALAWLTAGLVAIVASPPLAVWTLFAGGMLIHPIGMLLTRALGRSAAPRSGNPLVALALETTVWLILSLPLAYAVSLLRIEWFFPAMLVVIGGRYFTFATLYGSRMYWACGGALALAGILLARADAPAATGALTGAAIETVFAAVILAAARREPAT